MKIWMIVAVCAFVFLVCFLLDTLFKHLFPKSKLEKSKQAVRPARRSATFGVILLFVPVVVLLFMFLPIKMKYLALADAALYLYYFIVGGASTRVTIVLCLLNVFLFLGGDIINTIRRESRYWKTRYNFRKAMRK